MSRSGRHAKTTVYVSFACVEMWVLLSVSLGHEKQLRIAGDVGALFSLLAASARGIRTSIVQQSEKPKPEPMPWPGLYDQLAKQLWLVDASRDSKPFPGRIVSESMQGPGPLGNTGFYEGGEYGVGV